MLHAMISLFHSSIIVETLFFLGLAFVNKHRADSVIRKDLTKTCKSLRLLGQTANDYQWMLLVAAIERPTSNGRS